MSRTDHNTRMTVERHQKRHQSPSLRLLLQLLDKAQMPSVYPVKDTQRYCGFFIRGYALFGYIKQKGHSPFKDYSLFILH